MIFDEFRLHKWWIGVEHLFYFGLEIQGNSLPEIMHM